jgi:large subunit ribosomal protein L31e
MADKTQTKIEEREYIIPIRRYILKKARYRRTGLAIKRIKQFIARHMKVEDRDTSKVKIDVHFNNDFWFRGRAKPPAKVKVKAIKEGDIVKVTFAEMPEYVRFAKQKQEKFHKPTEVKKEISSPQGGAPQQSEEARSKSESDSKEKKDEKEKEQSSAEQKALQAKQQSKAEKHTTKVKEPSYHRVAMKK